MEDEKIVELYLERDEDAIAQTEKKYGVALQRIAFHIIEDRESAKECENDAYLEAWQSIPPHEPRSYLFAFMGRIVRHLALDICKKKSRKKRFV